jgi:hypothetical protein
VSRTRVHRNDGKIAFGDLLDHFGRRIVDGGTAVHVAAEDQVAPVERAVDRDQRQVIASIAQDVSEGLEDLVRDRLVLGQEAGV